MGLRFHSYPALVVEEKRLTFTEACTSFLVDLKLKKKRHLLSLLSLWLLNKWNKYIPKHVLCSILKYSQLFFIEYMLLGSGSYTLEKYQFRKLSCIIMPHYGLPKFFKASNKGQKLNIIQHGQAEKYAKEALDTWQQIKKLCWDVNMSWFFLPQRPRSGFSSLRWVKKILKAGIIISTTQIEIKWQVLMKNSIRIGRKQSKKLH